MVIKNSESPIQYVKGIGPKRAAALEKLDIYGIKDLFFYFPHGYLDRSQIVRIADLRKYARLDSVIFNLNNTKVDLLFIASLINILRQSFH